MIMNLASAPSSAPRRPADADPARQLSQHWSLAPRHLAYPISVRDCSRSRTFAFSSLPGRRLPLRQSPGDRDRGAVGNPALTRHRNLVRSRGETPVCEAWALQTSVFFRDVYDQIGVEDFAVPAGPTDLRYVNVDQSSTLGFEWSVVHESRACGLEASYTWMQASGNESRPGGDPYGPVRLANTPATGTQRCRGSAAYAAVSAACGARVRTGRSAVERAALTAALDAQAHAPDPDRHRRDQQRAAAVEREHQPEPAVGVAVRARRRAGPRGAESVRPSQRSDATVDGYPNSRQQHAYDDYGAYRTETGNGGGAYYTYLPEGAPGHWVPVHDPS